jgi:hypothetical protein
MTKATAAAIVYISPHTKVEGNALVGTRAQLPRRESIEILSLPMDITWNFMAMRNERLVKVKRGSASMLLLDCRLLKFEKIYKWKVIEWCVCAYVEYLQGEKCGENQKERKVKWRRGKRRKKKNVGRAVRGWASRDPMGIL